MDVDTGVDDTMALLLAAQSPRINLLAATSTFGNTFTSYATQNTLNALALCGRTDVPVASGTRRPWKKKLRTSPISTVTPASAIMCIRKTTWMPSPASMPGT